MKLKLIFLTYLFQFIALSALAYDAEIDGIYYNLNQTDQTAQVTFFENNKPVYSGDIILPESVPYDGVTYKVTSIGKQAFDNCSELRSMVIPNSVTSIEEFSFFNCNLRCLTMGSGVKEINYRAFVCQITKVIWLTNTPPSGYNNVQGLVHYVPNDQYTAFNNKKVYSFLSSLFEVDGIKYIPVSLSERTCDVIDCIDDEFHNEVNITAMVSYKGVDMKVLNVQPYTFYQNRNLSKVILNVAGSIGPYMFYGCKNLQSASLGNDVTGIDEYAFSGCSSLERIVVPDSVKEIGQYAFSDCPTMTSAIIGNGTQTLGQYSFSNCSSLTSVCIGNGTRDIEEFAFSGCSGLTSIIIGNSTKTIRQYAFQNCSSLFSITIPSSLYSIRDFAFSGCISLKEITLVDRYEDKATTTYDDLSISKTSSINSSTTFEVSEGDVLSFHYSLNNAALRVYLGDDIIKYSKDNSGDYIIRFDKSGTIRIRLEGFWQNNSYSGKVTGIKVENDGTLALGSNGNEPLFASCPLDSVYIGRNITYSKSPFYANKSLRSVEISDRDKAISANEFYGCTNLQNVEIGNGVKSIGDWAFSGCSALDVFAFGTSVESIGKEAFSDCNSLTQIVSRAITPPTCEAQALDDINKWSCKLVVPKGYLESYQAADQWKDFFFIEEYDFGFKHTITYMVDGEEYKSYVLDYGTTISPEPVPSKEGYTFSGWYGVPETMPAHDVMVNGSFTVNKYKVRYYVGEQLIAEDEVEYGDEVVLRDYTPVDAARYTFIGWEGEKYETMPAHDIEYHANIADGINGLAIGNLRGVQAIYDANGRKLSKIQSGGNILLMRDGTKRKVVVK